MLVLPTSVKTKGVDAAFVESISVLNALSSSFALPDNVAIESVVEAVITGPNFEDCLVCFMKRVVEEAFISERSKLIMANLKVVMNNRKKTVHTIPVADIKSKRNQVLSLMKGAILDDGEIYLDIFLYINRDNPNLQKARAQVDVTEGFINITRKYKFSYVDEKNNCRCFSKYPLESLLRGVFLDANHAKLYVSVYSGHASRMKKGSADDADVNLLNTLGLMADKTNAALEKGEIPVAMGWLIQLECLLSFSSTSKQANRCLQQLGSIMRSSMGYIRIVREAAICLRKAIRHISANMTEFTDKMDKPGDGIISDELKEEKATILSRYSKLAPSILALKALIISMISECNFSEMTYVADGLINNMWALFSPSCRSDPLLDPDTTKLNAKKDIVETITLMNGIDAPIKHICSTLFMLEVSCGVMVVSNIIERDFAGFPPSMDNYDNVIPEQPKPFSAVPRNLMELLGYVKAWPRDKRAARPTSWVSFEVSDWMLYFCRFSLQKYALVPFYNTPSLKGNRVAKSKHDTISGVAEVFMKKKGILNACAELGVNDLDRHGAIDLEVCTAEEGFRYDAPLFMTTQAAKMRYLGETHVLRCLNEACYQTLNEPQTKSPYTTLTTNLFRFASFLNLTDNLPDEAVDAFVFANARKGLITVPPKCKFGMYLVDLLDKFGATVIGPFGVLAGMGDLKQVYRFVWFVPPLFSSTPEHKAGMNISICGGVALESVMKLAAPELQKLRGSVRKDTLAGKYSYNTNEDDAALDYVGHISIEVPVKILYDGPRREEQARTAFADTVTSAVQHLLGSPQWRFRCLTPCDKHSVHHGGVSREPPFTKQNIAGNSCLLRIMGAAMAKTGVAVVQADMLLPDLGELPSFEQFSDYFEASAHGSMTEQEFGDSVEASDSGGSFLVDDTQRLCADKEVGSKLREATRLAFKSYVPCTIRFTLLGSVMSPPSGREEGKNKFVEKLEIGSPDDLARLTGSTLWFSQRSGRMIWKLADSSAGIRQCIALEALHNWYLHKESTQMGLHCQALREAQIFALLTNRFRLASDFARVHQSFGMKLMHVAACLDMLVDMFSSKDLVSLNVAALGNTLTRHVSLALRLIISSSESVHLQGGCFLMLEAIGAVEKGLHLGQISFASLRQAPTRGLPHPSLAPRLSEDPEPSLEESEESLGVPAEAILLRRLSVSSCLAEVLEDLKGLRSFALVLLECMGKDAFNSLESLRALLTARGFPGYLDGGSEKAMQTTLGPAPKAPVKEIWLRGTNQMEEVVVKKHHSMKLLSKQVAGAMKFVKAGGDVARHKKTMFPLAKSTKEAADTMKLALPLREEVENEKSSPDNEQHFDPFNFKGDVSQPSYKVDAKTKEDARLDRNQVDYSFYYDSVHNQPNSFSSRGFKRALGPGAGDSVATAIKGKSMLNVLRAYSAIDPDRKESLSNLF